MTRNHPCAWSVRSVVPYSSTFENPNALQRKLSADVFVQPIVVREYLFDQIVLIPEPHSEKLARFFSINTALEAAPRDHQSLSRMEVLHRSDELIQRGSIERRVTRFYLYADSRFAEYHWSRRG